jgi:hypothetical protein
VKLFSTPDRMLVVDEDLNKRLVTELRHRGRQISGIRELELRGSDDRPLLQKIHSIFHDSVLITGDDHMPDDHAQLIEELGATIATIAPCAPQDPNEDEYEREIVHRWAHAMHVQPTGTQKRYYLNGPRTWTTRKR